MRVAEIVIVPPHLADGGFRAFVIAEARPEELLQLCKHLRRHIVAAAGGKLFHQTGDQAVIAGEQVQQALEIAGHEDIHRRRDGLIERAPAVIVPGAQEVGQDVVGVGRANEPADRQSHFFGKVAGENIAEVAGRHDVVHLVAGVDAPGADEVGVGAEIINDLRGKTADIDRVCGRKAHAAAVKKLFVPDCGKYPFHARLRIVKVSPDRAHADVASLLRGHLRFLHGAHAAVGIKDDDLRAGHVAKALHRRLAGVAGGRGENEDLVGKAALASRSRHQARQHGQRHILKGTRGTAEQLQHGVLPDGSAGGKVVGFKLIGVAGADELRHLLLRIVRQQRGQNNRRHRKRVQSENVRVVELNVPERRHGVKTAVGCKTV